jgi:hypothetical protein
LLTLAEATKRHQPWLELGTVADFSTPLHEAEGSPIHSILVVTMAPNTPLSTRALIVCLKSPFVGKSTSEIAKETGLSARTINSIYARAIERGFEPNEPLRIDDRFLVDALRSGRPRKEVSENLIQKVRRDRYSREKSCADLAGDLS